MCHLGVFGTPPAKLANALTLVHRERRAEQWARAGAGTGRDPTGLLGPGRPHPAPGDRVCCGGRLAGFACFLAEHAPEVDVRRQPAPLPHRGLQAPPGHTPDGRPGRDGSLVLSRRSVSHHLGTLDASADVPACVLIFAGDFPVPDKSLPRFLDDAAAAKLLRASREDTDPFVPLCVEFLARTGLRRGEVDAVVQTARRSGCRSRSANSTTTATSPCTPSSNRSSTSGSAPAATLCAPTTSSPTTTAGSTVRVDRAVARVARAAGLGRRSPHKLRHTLATQFQPRDVARGDSRTIRAQVAHDHPWCTPASRTAAWPMILRCVRQGRSPLRPASPTARGRRRCRDAKAARRDAPTHALQRLLRPACRNGLPLRVDL